jgi:hypothetical protein
MGFLEGCLDGGGGLKVPASVLITKGNIQFFFHFLANYIKIGKVKNCQSNDITVNSTKMRIKSVRAILAPLPPILNRVKPNWVGIGK